MSIVELDKVSFEYKGADSLVLSDVSMSVSSGEVLVLCGESGCGKTTITRLINGLIPEFHAGSLWGSITVDGVDVSTQPVAATGRMVGSVLQNPHSQFFNVDTTSELAFGCENMAWDPARIEGVVGTVVREFQIENLINRNLFHLSGGEKQQIACACISAYSPDVIVLDEPTSNLDLSSIRRLASIIALWKRAGKTIVVAEHRLSYLIDIADRFIFLRQGQIIWEKSSQEVQALPSTELERYGLREVNPVNFSAKESDGLQDRTHAVDIHNLSFAYDRTRTTADLTIESLSIPSGAIVGIVGNNGAGKTTLARCICGLEKKSTGDLCFFGQKRNHKQRLKETYLVMQDVNHQLFASSVADEVELSMRFSKQDKAVQSQYRVSEILKRLNLEEYAQVHPVSLSGGQKQRVAIAGALAAQRKIVVFDEPTSGLDRIHMQQTAALLAELAGQGITCLVITHDPELIQTCCNWIIAMEEGSVSFSRPFDSLCATMLAEFFYAER